MATTNPTAIKALTNSSTWTFDVDELKEMLDSKKMYQNADNLPKWMRFSPRTNYRTWKAVWAAIESFVASPSETVIDVRY